MEDKDKKIQEEYSYSGKPRMIYCVMIKSQSLKKEGSTLYLHRK